MKYIKFLLKIILILLIALLLRYLYSSLYQDNYIASNFTMPFHTGTPDSIVDLNTVDSTPSTQTLNNTSSKFYRYYYEQIDDNAKIIYASLENSIKKLKDDNYKIDFSTQFNDTLNQQNGAKKLSTSFQAAIDAFFYDHPELFYIDLTQMSLYTRSTSFAGKTTYNISIVPSKKNYLAKNFSPSEFAEQAEKKVESIRNSFLKNVSGNDYNKVLQVHDTLVNLLQYDSTHSRTNTNNIYGALIEKKVVCEGYAKSFKYILDALEIPCILVGGQATNSSGKTESHMWNYVKINGKWYGVDPTWDDPIVVGASQKNVIRHDYLCRGSVTFRHSHVASNSISENGKNFTLPTLSVYDYK